MRTLHPVIFGRLRKWPGLLLRHRAPEAPFLTRILWILFTSALSWPWRRYEDLRYGPAVRRTKITRAPVFIIGYWRSGTTHVHNVLSLSGEFTFLSLFQTLAPEFFLSSERILKPLFGRLTPPRRPMDNVALSIDAPQEEELALLAVTKRTLYHQMFFPKQASSILLRDGLFDGLTVKESAEWRSCYEQLCKKLTFASNGKRLVLKNPANTCRIRALLDLFPDARFIHVVRNPLDVFPSCMHLFRTLVPICRLQQVHYTAIREYVMVSYETILRRYLDERSLVPERNLVEVRFEDFEASPVALLERIYDTFGIAGFDRDRNGFERYLDSVRNFRKGVYSIDDQERIAVWKRWRFAFDAFGYPIEKRSPLGTSGETVRESDAATTCNRRVRDA
ncbi:MAG: sulfotransferase [Chitinispirillaceae bacterium]|nr:sulfotransferase [Chitinispirillaceae bacterium]